MSATTPRKPSMASASSPSTSKTAPRRVLGDLTPKAINTPSKHAHSFEPKDMRAHSPLKQVTTLSPQVHLEKENIVGINAYPKGRKRTIYEVEGAEDDEQSDVKPGTRLTSSTVQEHTESIPVALPVPGSPTERNTPTPEPDTDPFPVSAADLEPEFMDSQESNQSFSGWLNLEMCASQNSDTAQPALPAPTSAPEPALEPVPVVEEKKSRAELLKVRLGLGMYKVKTNQVSKRSSEIISTWETTSSYDSLPASTSAAITSSAGSTTSQNMPAIHVSPACRDAEPKFVTANLDPFRPIGKLTPAPVLLPTAVSSRTIHEYHLPSSPPQQLLSPVRQQRDYRTLTGKRARAEAEDEEDFYDDGDETAEERLLRLRDKRLRRGELTSSAVKGTAAKGLIDLMNARK